MKQTQHANLLSEAEQERLSILIEEASEVIQIACKILRHGYASKHPNGGPTNRENLTMEMGHLRFAMGFLEHYYDVLQERVNREAEAKASSVQKYLHHHGSDWRKRTDMRLTCPTCPDSILKKEGFGEHFRISCTNCGKELLSGFD